MFTPESKTDGRPWRLSRTTVVDALAQSIRQRIVSGELAAGRALRQEALAEEYGVSRMPLREALRQLAAEGFVVFRANRGIEVAALSAGDIEELFDLRAVLEVELFERSIKNLQAGQLDVAAQALEASSAASEVAEWGALNWRFHKALYAACGRPHTLAIVERIAQNTDRYVTLHLLLSEQSHDAAHGEHAELLEAARAGRVKPAGALLRRHIDGAKRDLLERIAI